VIGVKSVVIAAGTWLVLAGLYLAFASNVGFRECTAAAVVAAIGTAGVIIFAAVDGVRFRFRWADLAVAWRIPYQVGSGTVQVMIGLGRQLGRGRSAGRVTAAGFDGGELEDPADQGRRALAVTYPTMTPNFIVMGFIRDRRAMLYHQIVPGPVPSIARKLGARL
jgi:hypothetical protein